LKVTILETGAPPPSLHPRFGTYPDMFRRLLGSDYVGDSYDVTKGFLPGDPQDHPAYLVTGSAAGVYDSLPWIPNLMQFLREAKGKARLIGICFGHQIMAEAFSGRVVKSDKGWGIGLQEYRLFEHASWMDKGSSLIRVPISHQDQVVDKPPCSTVLAGSDFCDIGALRYDDQPAISFQFHPEFDPEYAAALIELRRDRLSGADTAIQSLEERNDCNRVAGWLRAFLDEGVGTSP
jgi:GMP synthase-like glutamine amidotransferase